jgi:flagellar motor switch protein FliN/FliY
MPNTSSTPDSAKPTALDELPLYTRNLLHVRVPVTVTLAMKRATTQQILDLAPGAMIQFDKSCEETLELCIGEHTIAAGLVVKVGEKFGLKISHLTPPTNRLQTLKPTG